MRFVSPMKSRTRRGTVRRGPAFDHEPLQWGEAQAGNFGKFATVRMFRGNTVEARPVFRVVCSGLWLEKSQSVASLTLSGYSSVDITLLGRTGRVEGKRGLLI